MILSDRLRVFVLLSMIGVISISLAHAQDGGVGARSSNIIHDYKKSCLVESYGEFIESFEPNDDAGTVVMKDGAHLPFDDGRPKTFEEKLDDPDLEDQLALSYPKGPVVSPAAVNFDPGRVRVEAFFKSVYGRTPKEVTANLVSIDWPARKGAKEIRFNRNAQAALALSRVAEGLKDLDSASRKVAYAVGGTYNHRKVAGTGRLSAHAFGIAIDIDVKHSAYWRWSKTFLSFVSNIPQDVIDLFERNKFIWGGKWYHFDTMHFEYRPELFCAHRP